MTIRYTTSPHLFDEEAEEAFIRVRNKVSLLERLLFINRTVLKLNSTPLLGIKLLRINYLIN